MEVNKMNVRRFFLTFALIILSSLLVTACAGGVDAPAQAVENYYQALADKDQDLLVSLTCADFETTALRDFDSFVSVETTLTDFACETVSENGDTASVTCTGAISATYQGEAQEFPLSGQTNLTVKQAGEWLMCGYE
jgi:hypothetical protein